MQEHDGCLPLITDCWTSPNHITYTALLAQLEVKGVLVCLVLNVVELPKVKGCSWNLTMADEIFLQSHTGLNMAIAFKEIPEEPGIEHKVPLHPQTPPTRNAN